MGERLQTVVEFFHGSLLDLNCCDWTRGDVVLANSICFSPAMMMQIGKLSEGLAPGAFLVTLGLRPGLFGQLSVG